MIAKVKAFSVKLKSGSVRYDLDLDTIAQERFGGLSLEDTKDLLSLIDRINSQLISNYFLASKQENNLAIFTDLNNNYKLFRTVWFKCAMLYFW